MLEFDEESNAISWTATQAHEALPGKRHAGTGHWLALLMNCLSFGAIALLATPAVLALYASWLLLRNPYDDPRNSVPINQALRPWLAFLPMAIKPSSLKSGVAKARKAAGFDNVRFHDLRHACATILLSQGVPLHLVRDVLGHASIRTTERDAHTLVEAQRDALDKFSDLHRKITPAPSSVPQ